MCYDYLGGGILDPNPIESTWLEMLGSQDIFKSRNLDSTAGQVMVRSLMVLGLMLVRDLW